LSKKHFLWVILPLPLMIALACNLTAAATHPTISTSGEVPPGVMGTTADLPGAVATGTPTSTPVFSGAMPGDPPGKMYWIDDINEQPDGNGGFARGGDNFDENDLERPYNKDMAYRRDLDILGGMISKDTTWFYVTIQLVGQNSTDSKMDANYGVELDLNLDGRGEFVIWALPPFTSQWTRSGAKIYGTSTNQVGGPHPMISDAPWTGLTYDLQKFVGATDFVQNGAWARVSPMNPNNIEIAFNLQMVGAPAKLMWGVWADDGIKDPSKFDYNDTFTRAAAGVPYAADANYPPKAVFAVDNTCRGWFGFEPTGEIPGSCIQPATLTPKPTLTFTKFSKPPKTKTPTIGHLYSAWP
jgi:hypothetical protein